MTLIPAPVRGGGPSLHRGNVLFWLAALLVFIILLWLLRTILLPFVAGMAVAYFLDPLADRLERLGVGRTWAALILCIDFFLAVPLLIVLLAPVIGEQLGAFAQRIPEYAQDLVTRLAPFWRAALAHLSAADSERLQAALSQQGGELAGKFTGLLGGLVSGGLVIVDALSLLFITPVVAFYLLRDWHRFTSLVNSWLPLARADAIRGQFRAIDAILGGYVRGQALVCLSLAVVYALGLTIAGLDLGLVLGLGIGLLAFVPYLGTATGLVIALSLAFAQSIGWGLVARVLVVFVIGHLLEGYVLGPRLVGKNIGLHPVWVIFALLAGGALFGLLGILLALPTAAVVGVLTRFALTRYLDSQLYQLDPPEGAQLDPPESQE